jgi:hypothetical protein
MLLKVMDDELWPIIYGPRHNEHLSNDDRPVAFSLEKHLPSVYFLMMMLTFNY